MKEYIIVSRITAECLADLKEQIEEIEENQNIEFDLDTIKENKEYEENSFAIENTIKKFICGGVK